jgi:quinol monooxygenase YgiN
MGVAVLVDLLAKETPGARNRVKAALDDAAAVYTKDPGTLEWLPIQDTSDERKFSVIEKFESNEVSLQCRPHHRISLSRTPIIAQEYCLLVPMYDNIGTYFILLLKALQFHRASSYRNIFLAALKDELETRPAQRIFTF